jgi:hypothetical protein
MTERRDSIVDHSSTAFDYDNYMLSMMKDGKSIQHSLATEDNVQTDYRLSLPSSSQMNTYRLNINSTLSESRKKFLSRIITVAAIFIVVVCVLLVTLTLRLAYKIDELVRLKQLMPKPNTFLLISTTTRGLTTNNHVDRGRTLSSTFTPVR